MNSTVLKSDILDLAKQDKLRLRAFGETVVYGHHRPFDGNLRQAVRALSRMIDRGLVCVYRDESGLFVGPADPALIDSDEVRHGI